MSVSNIVLEIKKERLKRHLDEVEAIIRKWRQQLFAPQPFRPSDSSPWPQDFKPELEQDPDNNHILRSHVKSRAFWRHHSDWAKKREMIRRSGSALLKVTGDYMDDLMGQKPKIQPTIMFERTALEAAFARSCDMSMNQKYMPSSQGGVDFGGRHIEESVSTEGVDIVQQHHESLMSELQKSDDMKEIVVHWKDVKKSEASMSKLTSDVLKSGDFIYPCRFCRKLFKT